MVHTEGGLSDPSAKLSSVAHVRRKHGVTGNSLWPATIVESLAAINFKLGDA